MRILPPILHPPKEPTRRRHKPRPATGKTGYQAFRDCLRWDFGFVCPFCLLHESDLVGGGGAERSGLTTVEHRVLQSADVSQRNDYNNCIYACRYCNRARSTTPIEQNGQKLLDPTVAAWANHFAAADDRLLPMADNVDASYTYETYDLDDPIKCERRRLRRELITNRISLLRDGPQELSALLGVAEELGRAEPEAAQHLLRVARRLREQLVCAPQDLSRFNAIPPDAPTECRCRTKEHHVLPPEFDRQMLNLAST